MVKKYLGNFIIFLHYLNFYGCVITSTKDPWKDYFQQFITQIFFKIIFHFIW